MIVLALTACGGGGKTTATTETTAPPPETMTLRVYFLGEGKVAAVAREVPQTQAVAGAGLEELYLGPTKQERDELKLSTEVPETTHPLVILHQGVVSLDLPSGYSRRALAQIVYTLTQFPTVRAVEIDGRRYSRADFEDETPAILVESPLPGETVRSPLRARGTANTFEATFEYDLTDPEGKIVAHNFVTATSGSGTRGTFDVTVPFITDRSGPGELIVYEISAEDGSRIHLVEIPIRLER